jgi:predicted P-loop ATPase
MQNATHIELKIAAKPARRQAAARVSRFDRSEIMKHAYRIYQFEVAKHDRIVASIKATGRTPTRVCPTLGECMSTAWAVGRRAVERAANEAMAMATAAARTPEQNAAQDANIIAGVAAFGNE